jgi:hypothetical protein
MLYGIAVPGAVFTLQSCRHAQHNMARPGDLR